MAATSISIPSFTPITLSFPNPKPISPSPNSLPFFSPKFKPLTSLSLSSNSPPFPSRFVTSVAVSSEIQEDEEEMGESGGRVPRFDAALRLFVGNLPYSVDSAQLAGLFETAGSVEMVEVIYDKVSGRSRGFGFVTMSTVEDVEAAAQQLNGYELEGRQIRVNAGPPPPKRDDSFSRGPSRGEGGDGGRSSMGSSNRIHVSNLSWGVDDLALKTLFSEHGDVLEARVIYDRDTGRSRGFGFVTFNSSEEVSNAIETLDGVDLLGRSIRVAIAESRPRREF